MYFSENIIKFEALTQTPLKGIFGGVSLDEQLKLADEVVESVKVYAKNKNLPHPDRRTWKEFRTSANWNLITAQILVKIQNNT